jgi:hypothetical protein
MKRHGNTSDSLPHGSDGGVFDSQSWKWLTERLAYLPQVRLVFGEELPQSASPDENFEEP